jgi:hypothetical protein
MLTAAIPARKRPSPSVARGLATIAERFGDVDPADGLDSRKIGDCPRDFQHAVIASRRQPHRRGRAGQQGTAGLVGGGDLLEQRAIGLGIGADAMVGIARRLNVAHPGDPRRNRCAASAGGGKVRSAALTP